MIKRALITSHIQRWLRIARDRESYSHPGPSATRGAPFFSAIWSPPLGFEIYGTFHLGRKSEQMQTRQAIACQTPEMSRGKEGTNSSDKQLSSDYNTISKGNVFVWS